MWLTGRMRIADLLSPLAPLDANQPNGRAGRVPIYHFTVNGSSRSNVAEFNQLHRLAEAAQKGYYNWGDDDDETEERVKPKRKRASSAQLAALRQVFQQTPFPSTEMRRRLAKSLGMTVRSVQIWFQNQRQSARGLLHAKRKSPSLSNSSSTASISP